MLEPTAKKSNMTFFFYNKTVNKAFCICDLKLSTYLISTIMIILNVGLIYPILFYFKEGFVLNILQSIAICSYFAILIGAIFQYFRVLYWSYYIVMILVVTNVLIGLFAPIYYLVKSIEFKFWMYVIWIVIFLLLLLPYLYSHYVIYSYIKKVGLETNSMIDSPILNRIEEEPNDNDENKNI